jgi:hypothetical protein
MITHVQSSLIFLLSNRGLLRFRITAFGSLFFQITPNHVYHTFTLLSNTFRTSGHTARSHAVSRQHRVSWRQMEATITRSDMLRTSPNGMTLATF